MSLKIKTAARLKALFAGVALSKKSVDAIGDQLAILGLTDDSTDEEIDVKLNERNAIHSFEDQKKFEDYQIGKATKDASDKEAARLKAIEEGKQDPATIDPNESSTDKLLKALMAKMEKQDQAIAEFGQKEVSTNRNSAFSPLLEKASPSYKKIMLHLAHSKAALSDEDYNSWLEETKVDIAENVQEYANSGLGGERPIGGGGNHAMQEKTASAESVAEIMNLI